MKNGTRAEAIVIGGGPAGSASAIRLLERGITPLIIEREPFPRYHIGESMTGECGGLVRDLGFEAEMLAVDHPRKEGVCVWGNSKVDWWIPMMLRGADGELHDQYTWQVRRSVFDAMLLDGARSRGAEFLAGRAVAPLMSDDGSTMVGVRVRTDDGAEVDVASEITLDCSGQATFLANQKVTGPKYLGSYDKQIAIFSQVADYVRDDEEGNRRHAPGNAHIYYKSKYHWAWAIPIEQEITSVGIVAPAQYYRNTGESRSDYVVRELGELHPELAARTPNRKLEEDAHVIPNYSFQVRKFAGPGYICVGDAHRFVDPIFSFGMYVALREAGLAAEAAAGYLAGDGRDSDDPFYEYMVRCEAAIDILEDMIDTFWENPLAFSVFVHRRFRDPMIDVFSGRIYDGMKGIDGVRDAMLSYRRLLKRERTYDRDGLYSVPIGSRFHAERAPLWDSHLETVETTEHWIRDNA